MPIDNAAIAFHRWLRLVHQKCHHRRRHQDDDQKLKEPFHGELLSLDKIGVHGNFSNNNLPLIKANVLDPFCEPFRSNLVRDS